MAWWILEDFKEHLLSYKIYIPGMHVSISRKVVGKTPQSIRDKTERGQFVFPLSGPSSLASRLLSHVIKLGKFFEKFSVAKCHMSERKFAFVRKSEKIGENRFATELTEEEVLKLLDNATPANTKKATKYSMKIFQGNKFATIYLKPFVYTPRQLLMLR